MKRLRIFAASPSDTATERAKVETVALMLKPLADSLGIMVDVAEWSVVVPDMGRPEQVILDQLKPTSWDVFIGILWHRFGTPPSGKDAQTQEDYLSGTEEEFKTAYRLWQQYGRPRIMIYRCTRPIPPEALDPEQFKRVKEFFAKFDAVKGVHPGLYQSFEMTESFERLLHFNLQKLLLEYIEEVRGKPVSAEVVQALVLRNPVNLPRRASFFGRDNDMDTTLRALAPEDRTWGVLLDGIGGIGKTALAVEAAYRTKEKGLFDAFIFVSAKRNVLNPSGIRELSPVAQALDDFLNETTRVLGETSIIQLAGNDKRRALLNVLRGRRALLIYDNLETLTKEEQEAVADFLRELPQGCKAIITSRRRGGEGAVWLRLERLEWAAARALIESEIDRDPQLANKIRRIGETRWQELYDETKGSPLALVHTLGLIRVRAALTFEGALALLRGNQDPDLQKFIFQEARRELTANDETALCALSFFAPSATFEAWMYVSQLSRNALESTVDRLSALSLVDVMSGQERYTLHPLTRSFVGDELLTDRQLAAEMKMRVTRYLTGHGRQNGVQRVSSSLGSELVTSLEQLAWNYWWSWASDGPSVFRDLDAEIWAECEQNPRLLLGRISEYRLTEMASDPVYVERVRRLSEEIDGYMQSTEIWSSQNGLPAISPEHPVAYFCAEYAVHNSLPLYSGGLGVLAGDHLKSASDLKVPLVAIGLFYRYGYFRQRLRRDGWQEEYYGEAYPSELPLIQVRQDDDNPLLIELMVRNRLVRAQVWRADVGRIALYLLDTNIEENDETDRWIAGHLYGGDRETRIVQEMVLGIGGVRLLRKLGLDPHVFHLNESHSAFLTLELVRERIKSDGISFAGSSRIVREQCVFTTHMSIAIGTDEFDSELVRKCLGSVYEQELGLSHEELIALGRVEPENSVEAFGLTPLAIRMCRSANGVSRKHGEVSRALWHKLWPERTIDAVPISHVTNGIHLSTWVARPIRALYEKRVAQDWAAKARDVAAWMAGVEKITDEELWRAHRLLKQRLIAFIRHRSFHARLDRSESIGYTESARTMFDPEALTIGFARRVVGYKRWDLLLTDPDRLLRLMNDETRPVQFVFAGKAHPQDQQAKQILQQLAQWGYDQLASQRAVFLQDYDQEIARQLVQSVDVWLTVPRRPLEPSGTSGQKAAINGGLNLSILDGWWLEAYDGTNGFAIGDTGEIAETVDVDKQDAESLYRVLEENVVPLYYERDADRLPRKWIAMMKRSISTLGANFNSDRMVAEYAERIYT
jgi:glycogen phosphorylase